jgi:DNA-binding NtrC family response regulator
MKGSVLLVDDDASILQAVGKYLERCDYEVFRESTGQGGITEFDENKPDLVLLDLGLPDLPGLEVLERLRDQGASVIVLTGFGNVETAVKAMQLGAENFLAKPVDLPHLSVAVDRAYEKVRLRREVDILRAKASPSAGLESLGSSPGMQDLSKQVQLLAESDRTTVLLTGESGTGKGFVARMMHDISPRRSAPFIDVNCGGLTANFLDSELFGHERGAFTDAKERKQGLFELAQSGTIFLDEIGDLAPELQPKLLRVLESKTFRRIGGTREISVDVRLIAATNKDLSAEVTSGRFREDLYYRLSVLPLHMIPVRERSREDRLALLQRLLADLSHAVPGTVPAVSASALQRLLAYGWPGNVREMRNVLERSLILASGSEVRIDHLPPEIKRGRRATDHKYEGVTLQELECRHIERALRHYKGNRTHAARELGISRATLINKIKAYNIGG